MDIGTKYKMSVSVRCEWNVHRTLSHKYILPMSCELYVIFIMDMYNILRLEKIEKVQFFNFRFRVGPTVLYFILNSAAKSYLTHLHFIRFSFLIIKMNSKENDNLSVGNSIEYILLVLNGNSYLLPTIIFESCNF